MTATAIPQIPPFLRHKLAHAREEVAAARGAICERDQDRMRQLSTAAGCARDLGAFGRYCPATVLDEMALRLALATASFDAAVADVAVHERDPGSFISTRVVVARNQELSRRSSERRAEGKRVRTDAADQIKANGRKAGTEARYREILVALRRNRYFDLKGTGESTLIQLRIAGQFGIALRTVESALKYGRRIGFQWN